MTQSLSRGFSAVVIKKMKNATQRILGQSPHRSLRSQGGGGVASYKWERASRRVRERQYKKDRKCDSGQNPYSLNEIGRRDYNKNKYYTRLLRSTSEARRLRPVGPREQPRRAPPGKGRRGGAEPPLSQSSPSITDCVGG